MPPKSLPPAQALWEFLWTSTIEEINQRPHKVVEGRIPPGYSGDEVARCFVQGRRAILPWQYALNEYYVCSKLYSRYWPRVYFGGRSLSIIVWRNGQSVFRAKKSDTLSCQRWRKVKRQTPGR
ncbi:unnamed protein product [Ascophyllum nodosum]